jgi:hypothetical protein
VSTRWRSPAPQPPAASYGQKCSRTVGDLGLGANRADEIQQAKLHLCHDLVRHSAPDRLLQLKVGFVLQLASEHVDAHRGQQGRQTLSIRSIRSGSRRCSVGVASAGRTSPAVSRFSGSARQCSDGSRTGIRPRANQGRGHRLRTRPSVPRSRPRLTLRLPAASNPRRQPTPAVTSREAVRPRVWSEERTLPAA